MRGALTLALALILAPIAAAQTADAPPRTLTTETPATPAPPPTAPAAALQSSGTETPGEGAGEAITIKVDTSQGYARIGFLWKAPVQYEASISDGVLVLTFARPFKITQGNLPLDSYVSVIRQDPGSRTLRLQLKQKLRLHTSAAGPLVGIDLLPAAYKGEPADVVDPTAKPPPPSGPVAVKLLIMVKEDRTRIVFEWGEKVPYEAKIADGKITATFDRGGSVDVARLNKNPPGWVKSATASGGDNQLLLEITIDPESAVEHFRDKTAIAFDVMAPKNDKDAEKEPEVVVPDEIVAEAEGQEPPAPPAEEPPLRPGSDGAAVEGQAEPAPPAEEPAHAEGEPAHAEPAHEEPEHAEAEPAAPAHEDPAPAEPAHEGPAHAEAEPAHGEPAHAEAPPEAAPAHAPPFAVERSRDTVMLVLPALASDGAAMFRRGDRIHVLFEGTGAVDAPAIVAKNKDLVETADVRVEGGVTILTVVPKKPLAVTALVEEGGWVAALSPDPLEPPAAVALLRDARTLGPARVRATLDNAHRVVALTDPDSGETLLIALAAGKPAGVIGARRYVEFAADTTAQGLVVRPFADDVTLTPGAHEVIIATPNGLTLSAGAVAGEANALGTGGGDNPAAMDFAAWAGDTDFLSERSRLLGAIKPAEGRKGGDGVAAGRLALARFYLSYDLSPEAIGALQLVAMDDEKIVSDPAFRALRAVALLIGGRPKEAADDLSHTGLNDNAQATLLRGLAEAGQRRWSAARDRIVEGEAAIGLFRTDWQARLRLAAARAAIETNALDVADRMLNAMPKGDLPRPLAIEADLVRAMLAEKLKWNDEALRLYEEVVDSGYRPLAVRASFAEIGLKERTGAMKPAEAIKALDQLRWQWRGDEVELGVLHKLGALQIAEGDYRNGLQTMRAAVLGFPEQDETRKISAEMAVVFEDLFLHGKADALPPIQALGLYYDFKELTPIGAMGDEMVRRLADRLIAVDLLEQAAELLQHQVDRRLDGVAKAQIAAKLAAVYLMDRKPQRALAALRASSQTRLPETLAAQRRLLTGRALLDLKQYDAALDSFEQDQTVEAKRLRADVQWYGTRWPEAAAAIEVLIEGREKVERALDATDRYDILRAAVCYTMADDDAGLASLRQRFVALIADAPEAAAFELVTRKIDPSAVAFRDLAKAVAAVDTLDAFLQSLGLGKPADGTASAQ